MFVRQFMESLLLLRTCIVTMNLLFHGPRLCRRPAAASFELQRFMESPDLRGTRIGTMNRRGLLPLLHWRRGSGRGGRCFVASAHGRSLLHSPAFFEHPLIFALRSAMTMRFEEPTSVLPKPRPNLLNIRLLYFQTL